MAYVDDDDDDDTAPTQQPHLVPALSAMSSSPLNGHSSVPTSHVGGGGAMRLSQNNQVFQL